MSLARADPQVSGVRLPGPSGIDQIRAMRGLLADPVPVLDELRARYGPMVGLGMGPARMAIVGDPHAVAELFSLDPDLFRWNHKFNVLGFVVGKHSMIVSDGELHRRRRKAVTPGFARRRLNGWIPMIVAETDTAIDTALARAVEGDRGTPVDLYPIGRELVLRIVVRAMFGESLAARADEIGRVFERPQAYLESPAVRQLPHPFPFTRRSRVRADRGALDAIIDAELAHRRSAPGGDAPDVLSMLERSELDDAEIRDQIATLIGAGYDTTAASLAWILWCVSTTPGLAERLAREAAIAFADHPELRDHAALDHTVLARLELADRVVCETLRLHPAGVASPRETATDIALGGYRIPARTLLLWSAHLTGRDPAVWPDPLRFDPDRLADADETQQGEAARAWVPFGGGARNCIGFALARMELTLIIARMAQAMVLTPIAAEVPRPYGLVVNRPVGGVPMRIAARPGRDGEPEGAIP